MINTQTVVYFLTINRSKQEKKKTHRADRKPMNPIRKKESDKRWMLNTSTKMWAQEKLLK